MKLLSNSIQGESLLLVLLLMDLPTETYKKDRELRLKNVLTSKRAEKELLHRVEGLTELREATFLLGKA